MDSSSLFLTFLVVAVEIAIVSAALGGVSWWLYRRAFSEAQAFKSEKRHLLQRRDAHLRFLNDRLNTLAMRRHRQKGTETRLENLERRILEEDKKHTEAARDRDTEIWDLRTASTKALIDAVRAMDPSALDGAGRASGSRQDTSHALRHSLKEREEQVERQRREIQQLSPFRDAWSRLHRYARNESAENAALRDALRRIPADAATTEAIGNVLQTYANDRAALDDYLEATAASYEEANPEQARRARQRQQRMNRMHKVVDTASSRMDAASQRFPAVLNDQNEAISDLEFKLERAEQAQQVIRQNYSREIQRLKKNNQDAENTARSLEKENRRLRQRVRNLIRLTQEDSMAFVPGSQAGGTSQEAEENARKDAEIDRLHQALRQERTKTERLEKQVEKYQTLEAAIQSTLHEDSQPA
ncbi:hypothetical protein QWY84_18270 [Aquisalimonas lutea]|uniref:hypothetical protein n=1 Tax=Aquisalimonas lutea TaxID=1327750 RepID=UPI0025B399BE|nr:hypothetical protein [Aquisalimonas lutea]MDN3519558.1 hypothetical protein [Aquisalimonas lutea]